MVKRVEIAHFGGVTTPSDTPPQPAAMAAACEAALQRIVQRIQVELPAEIEQTETQLTAARETVAEAAGRIETLRTARQKGLADGQDVAALSQEISAVRAQHDLAEDLAQGLEAKRAALSRESIRLQTEEKSRAQQALFDSSIQPLVDEWNQAAERLGALTEALHRRANACGMSLAPGSVVTVWPSHTAWNALRIVPRLCRPGAVGDHWFDLTAFTYRIQQEQRAKAAEAA